MNIQLPRGAKISNIPILALFVFHFPSSRPIRRLYGINSNDVLILWAMYLLWALGYQITKRKLRNKIKVYSKPRMSFYLSRLLDAKLIRSSMTNRGKLRFQEYHITDLGFQVLREMSDNFAEIYQELIDKAPLT